MKVDFGRWTTTKAALAVAGALAIAGAVGSAVAFSPTVQAPIKWQGGWEAAFNQLGNSFTEVYLVPNGRNLLVTDIIASTTDTNSVNFLIYNGTSSNCADNTKYRTYYIPVPAGGVVHLPLQTGMGFGAGQRMCVSVNGDGLQFLARGFLFSPN